MTKKTLESNEKYFISQKKNKMSTNNVKNSTSSTTSSSATSSNISKSFFKSNSLFNLGIDTASIGSSFFNHKKPNTARHITFSNNNINDLKLSSFQVPNSPIDKLNTPRTVTVETSFFPPSPINENETEPNLGKLNWIFYFNLIFNESHIKL